MLPYPGQDAVPFTTLTAEFYDHTIANIEALAAGTAIDNGSITSAKLNLSDIWGKEIARSTPLASPGNTLTATGIPVFRYLTVFFSLIDSGGTINAIMRLNNDSGGNYPLRRSANGGADATTASGTSINIGFTSAAAPIFGELFIENNLANSKLITGRATSEGGAATSAIPDRSEFAAKWVDNSQATRIDIINSGAGSYAVGSEFIVRGHN